MFKIYSILLFFVLTNVLFAQPAAQISNTIDQLFEGMRTADSLKVKAVFYPNAELKTVLVNREGKTIVQSETVQNFLKAVATPHDKVFDERLMTKEIKIDGKMAMVWTPYKFYLGETFSHCGVNLFTLVETDSNWQILSIIDTRKRQGCEASSEEANQIHMLLDNWHVAAAEANFEAYFNPLSDDHIFLGTDETERWSKTQFKTFAKPYFDKGKVWDFKPYNRYIMMSDDGNLAWFDENLETWMGVCRGSGVLVKTNGEWKIKHYNLAMLVPNDKINAYLKILKPTE